MVIVTGGANGIGRTTCLAFAKQNAKVAIADIEADAGKVVVGEIKSLGGKALYIRTDVTKAAEVSRMVENVLNEFGQIDALVNDAGGWSMYGVPGKKLWEVSEEDWDKLHNLNLKSQFLCCKAVIPHMIRQNCGKIVNVSSGTVVSLPTDQSAYPVAKAGVIALTELLAKSLSPYRINVNCVGPGVIDTRVYKNRKDGTTLEKMVSAIPFGRAGRPEEVANLIVYLCSNLSDYTTGQTIFVSGGSR